MSDNVRYRDIGEEVLGGGIYVYDTPHSSMLRGDGEFSDKTGKGSGKDVMELGLLREGPSTLKHKNVKTVNVRLDKSKTLVPDLRESLPPSEQRVPRLVLVVMIVCLVVSVTALAVAGMALKNSSSDRSSESLLSSSGSSSKQGQAEKSVPGKPVYKQTQSDL